MGYRRTDICCFFNNRMSDQSGYTEKYLVLCYSPLTDLVKNGVEIHLWHDQDHFKLLIPIHNHGHNKCGQQELSKETDGVECGRVQIDRSDAEENYCWFEMSGGGQREEPELEKGQKMESKKVKGKLRKVWKKQSAFRMMPMQIRKQMI